MVEITVPTGRMAAAHSNPSKPIVLVVDDEPVVLRLASVVLSDAGFQPVVAENAAEGLEKYRLLRPAVSLVVVDVVMPGGTGLELASRIRELDSDVRILVMSGYSHSALEHEARSKYPYIRKPFLRGDLLNKVSQVLAAEAGGRS
jgi:two-component system cell cycle sensor histidine kinase/response regulator CckA